MKTFMFRVLLWGLGDPGYFGQIKVGYIIFLAAPINLINLDIEVKTQLNGIDVKSFSRTNIISIILIFMFVILRCTRKTIPLEMWLAEVM